MLQKANPKNDHIQVYIKDKLYPRHQAKVSVFDSTVQGGDAVWEGLRVYPQGIVCLDKHLTRLQQSAKTLAFTDIPSKIEIKKAIKLTLDANAPQFLDSKIHHNNLLNNIIAKIQANVAGKDAGLMLDDRGFVAELNGSNVFMIKQGKVYTPFAHACLPGITRNTVMGLCQDHGIQLIEADLSLSEFINAEGVFATGTMGELTPIVEIDGREISRDSQLMDQVLKLFKNNVRSFCEPLV